MGKAITFQDILKRELMNRTQTNPRYSIRAFAKDMQVPSSSLIQILSGKLGVSQDSAIKLAKSLKLSDAETSYFCASAESQFARKAMDRNKASKRLSKMRMDEKFKVIKLDEFSVIAEWQHYAILEILEIRKISTTLANVEEISMLIGMTPAETVEAIQRLERVGLIIRKEGLFQPNSSLTATPSGTPSGALKLHHEGLLKKAISSLKNRPVEERDISSIIMAVDKSQIELVRKKIKTFRRSLGKILNDSKNKNSVYCLSIQFHDLLNMDQE